MLSRQIAKSMGLLLRSQRSFSGGHHDHHDYSVHLDKEATWVKYKSVLLSRKRTQN